MCMTDVGPRRQKYTRAARNRMQRAARTPTDMPMIARSMAAVRSRVFFLCNDGKIYTRDDSSASPGVIQCVASNMSSTSGGLSTLACVSEDGCIFVRDYDPFASRDFGQQFGYFSARYATGTTSRFVAVACGDIHIAALDDAGVVWTMGVGPATGIPRQQQHAITKFERVDTEGFPQGRIEVVAAGSQHSAAVCCDGTLYTWGVNTSGELGIALHGGMSFETEPVQVGPSPTWICARTRHTPRTPSHVGQRCLKFNSPH